MIYEKMHKEDVTIIVPVYNCERYLDDCFKSIELQDFDKSKTKVIIVNDGSTDNSEMIIRKYCKKNNGWQYISQNNQGLSMSRNNALDVATTKYVMYLDSDDALPKTAISDMVNEIQKGDADIVVGGQDNYNSKGHFTNYTTKYLKNVRNLSYKNYPGILDFVHASAKLYKLDAVRGLRFIPNVTHEDNYYTLSIYLSGRKINMIDKIVYHHRVREKTENKSITQSLNSDTFKDLLVNYEKVIAENEYDYIFAKVLIKKIYSYALKKIPKKQRKESLLTANIFAKKMIKNCNCKMIRKTTLHFMRKGYSYAASLLPKIKQKERGEK